jgi:hypothetical protein
MVVIWLLLKLIILTAAGAGIVAIIVVAYALVASCRALTRDHQLILSHMLDEDHA